MRRIYWDTMLYIYWFENNRKHVRRIEDIYNAMQRRGDRLCCSSLVYAEVLVGPTITNDLDGKTAVDHFFRSSAVEILPFSIDAAAVFAQLRATGLKHPTPCTWQPRQTQELTCSSPTIDASQSCLCPEYPLLPLSTPTCSNAGCLASKL